MLKPVIKERKKKLLFRNKSMISLVPNKERDGRETRIRLVDFQLVVLVLVLVPVLYRDLNGAPDAELHMLGLVLHRPCAVFVVEELDTR